MEMGRLYAKENRSVGGKELPTAISYNTKNKSNNWYSIPDNVKKK